MKYLFFILPLLLWSCELPVVIPEETEIEKEETVNNNQLLSMEKHPIVFYNVENLFDIYDDPKNFGDDDFTEHGAMRWDEERYNTKLARIAEAVTMSNKNTQIGRAHV